MISYVITIGGEWYSFVQFYKWALALSKVNQRRAKCLECGGRFEPGECVHHQQYRHNGYVCIPCARKMLVKYGRQGYSENILTNLQANNFQTGTWDAQTVAEALKRDLIEDGFGNAWDARCDTCGNRSMQVIRPGMAKCAICEALQPADHLADVLPHQAVVDLVRDGDGGVHDVEADGF